MKELERETTCIPKSARARLLLTGPRVIIALAILKTFLWAINNSPVLSVCLFFLSALFSSPSVRRDLLSISFGCAHTPRVFLYSNMIQGNLRRRAKRKLRDDDADSELWCNDERVGCVADCLDLTPHHSVEMKSSKILIIYSI